MDFESFRRHTFAHVCEARSSQRVPTEGGKLTLIVVGTIPWAGGPEEIKGGRRKPSPGIALSLLPGPQQCGKQPRSLPLGLPRYKMDLHPSLASCQHQEESVTKTKGAEPCTFMGWDLVRRPQVLAHGGGGVHILNKVVCSSLSPF